MTDNTVETKTRGRLRVRGGAGGVLEFDGAVVERYRGRPALEALDALIREHARDPELRAMLHDPNLALSLYGPGADGEYNEASLSPTADFGRVVDHLDQAAMEIGVERRHDGGRWEVRHAA